MKNRNPRKETREFMAKLDRIIVTEQPEPERKALAMELLASFRRDVYRRHGITENSRLRRDAKEGADAALYDLLVEVQNRVEDFGEYSSAAAVLHHVRGLIDEAKSQLATMPHDLQS